MHEVERATSKDASRLADLYGKAFRKTGFAQFATEEAREELVSWINEHCEAGRLWFANDDNGPVALAHYDADKVELVTIVTRDGSERKGHAERLFRFLLAKYPSLKVRPVTKGGEALAKKLGFAPSKDDASLWTRVGQ